MATEITERDARILAFIAEHRFVHATQVRDFLRSSPLATNKRLRALSDAGLLRSERVFHRSPASLQITKAGLGAIGSSLPVPKPLDLHAYRHDLGLASLWLAARDGAFGAVREIVGERRMRSRDGRREPGAAPLGVRLAGVGSGGGERLHYPDLLLRTDDGRRVAVELELTGKSRTRLERILSGYGGDHRIDAVLYLVEDRRMGNRVAAAARRAGVEDLVHVQLFHGLPAAGPTPARSAERHAERGTPGVQR